MRPVAENPTDYINKVVNFRKTIFDKIISGDSNQIWLKASLKDVKKVVLINSASRSGSSLLFAILRRIPQVYSLSGESVPFYKLNRLSSDSFSSDRIPDELIEKEGDNSDMSRDFLNDFSIVRDEDDIIESSELLNQYIDDLILRFSIQWPQIQFSETIFKKLANQAFDVCIKRNRRFCKEEFYLKLLGLLKSEYPAINPYYYDIPQDMIREKFPDIEIPIGPPNDILTIEEPPFILLSPGKRVNKEDLSRKVLLLKSNIDCYRMNYIEAIFPNAEIKIIYLIRNPAASISGLYDGWLHRGFFSHNLNFFFKEHNAELKRLDISGYSDKYEWGKWWWNYDLPSGWQDYAEGSLQEVCAFQWYSANKTIQEYIIKSTKYYRCKYEDIVRSLDSRIRETEKIIDFIGIRQDEDTVEKLGLDKLPIVQTTQPPQPYRWKRRKDIILPILNDPRISDMSSKLGYDYDKENIEEWI